MQTVPEKADVQKRQVAKIVRISDLLEGEYVQQSGWLPNYIKTKSGIEVSRVNLIGILTEIFPTDIVSYVAIENFSATLDDGSGKMQLRAFEPVQFADQIQVGVPVLVIARPKKYSGDLFLVPEIIRKLSDNEWLEVRKKILDRKGSDLPVSKEVSVQMVSAKEEIVETEEKVEDVLEVEEKVEQKIPENVLDIIDKLDSGDGVLVDLAVEEIKKVRPEIDGKQRIMSFLLNGDLFEIRPGRIKVLK